MANVKDILEKRKAQGSFGKGIRILSSQVRITNCLEN